MIPARWLVLAAVLSSAAATWQLQAWRYGQQLAELARQHEQTLNQLTLAAAARQRADQAKHQALELRLQASDQTYSKALNDVQRDQARLRDRLATADLRLSVLIEGGGGGVPAASAPGRVVHGTTRAELDPAHAQRIIGITDAGDRGLIALQACQAYIRAIER